MSRKSRIDPVTKVKVVEKILLGELSISAAAKEIGVHGSTTTAWIHLYQSDGPSSLLDQTANKCYPKETKLAAVLDYLSGEGSQSAIAKKYKLRSTKQLRNWIKKYNFHGDLTTRGSGGGSYMRKARKTTYEERLSIVEDCLEHDHNYGAMALKYKCSYQQVRSWVKRYEEMGPSSLEDRRGKRLGTMPARTPEEELRNRIAELERKNKDLQMENDLLKNFIRNAQALFQT